MGNDPDLYSTTICFKWYIKLLPIQRIKIDDLFKRGAAELDSTKRKEIYNDLQREIAKEAYIYPIVDNQKILAVNKRVSGVNDAKLVPIYTFEDLSKISIK